MITTRFGDILLLLANNRICWWSDCNAKGPFKPVIMDCTLLAARPLSLNPFVVLLHDQRVLICRHAVSKPVDITLTIQKAHDACEIITSVHAFREVVDINTGILAVATEKSISIFEIQYVDGTEIGDLSEQEDEGISVFYPENALRHRGIKVTPVSIHKYAAGIDLVSISHYRAYVKTTDNKLYLLGAMFHDDYGFIMREDDYETKESQTININAQGISEIICGPTHSWLLMHEGSVSISRVTDTKVFMPIQFPDGVSIAKIVPVSYYALFISTEGQCYCDSTNGPIIIKAISHHQVENIYRVYNYVLVQHDGGQLCALTTSTFSIDPRHIDGTMKPMYLHYFDDKCITDIIQGRNRIYLTANDGNLYNAVLPSPTYPRRCRAGEIPFFRENPVMVQSMATIRSAGNALEP